MLTALLCPAATQRPPFNSSNDDLKYKDGNMAAEIFERISEVNVII
jgi:hypothetical protein